MSYGLLAIAAERKRQIDKGHTAEHDHSVSVLMGAAEAYLTSRALYLRWPAPADWDDLPLVERLATAGALIAAALDVLTDDGNER